MILALAPHTDDAILGAGGYMAAARGSNQAVGVYAFSRGNPQTGAASNEMYAASVELDLSVVELDSFPTRHFGDHRQDILAMIEAKISLYQPDVLLIPARHDHQDHQVVRREACRACRSLPITVLAYEQAWSQLMHPFHPACFQPLHFRDMVSKIRAVRKFTSQSDKSYVKDDYIIANAIRWGAYTRSQFAEAFEVVKWVM